jgi:hypothetical protein
MKLHFRSRCRALYIIAHAPRLWSSRLCGQGGYEGEQVSMIFSMICACRQDEITESTSMNILMRCMWAVWCTSNIEGCAQIPGCQVAKAYADVHVTWYVHCDIDHPVMSANPRSRRLHLSNQMRQVKWDTNTW